MFDYSNPIDLLAVFVLMGLMPFFAIMGTCFVKFAIVFSLLRNALGTQQTPPNLAIYGLAIMMTIYVMFPILSPVMTAFSSFSGDSGPNNLEAFFSVLNGALGPYKSFLISNSGAEQIDFFISLAKDLWPQEFHPNITTESYFILFPAFITSELIHAFQIGFLLYLPFLVIDIIVSNILLAMGMMMVSPVIFSLPFKIILFIASQGWENLIYVIATSYT